MRKMYLYEIIVNGKFYYSCYSKKIAYQKYNELPKRVHKLIRKVEVLDYNFGGIK